ncbi:MAG: TlpA family protein disulfide reductase [Pirellula sp.]|jgi:thiol-disulfide isomerase/thioredoxin|nr:TlpA family protein disulfide reductase [Pirellula sp.]
MTQFEAIAEKPPKPSYRHLFWAGLFMLTGLCILIYLGSERSRVIGQPIADLDLQPLINTESPFNLSDARGKFVLLHFWGPWCPPCRTEYPEIEKLAVRYSTQDEVCIVSISCASTAPDDVGQLQKDTEAMIAGPEKNHPIYCDPVEFSRIQVAKTLSQRGFAYPTTILLDREGQILNYWIGATRAGELARSIESALARTAIGPS